MTERFYVKGAKIKKTGVEGWFTVDEVCELLNQQDTQINRLSDELAKATELLYECEEQFRKYDGKKLFNLDYIVHSEIITKIMGFTK